MTKAEKEKIDNMTQVQMAKIYRFVPSGHPYFKSGTEISDYFMKKFKEKGGMTPAISKFIGWDN